MYAIVNVYDDDDQSIISDKRVKVKQSLKMDDDANFYYMCYVELIFSMIDDKNERSTKYGLSEYI